MRTNQGDVYHVESNTSAAGLPEHSHHLDLRINDADAALGDNAGEILICIKDRALFS